MSDNPPTIGYEAPGMIWRRRKNEWVSVWLCRTDIAEKGFVPRVVPLWNGQEPTDTERLWISQECNRLQADMLAFNRNGPETRELFDGTLEGLAAAYQTDPDSNFPRLRFGTREHYVTLINLIMKEYGEEDIKTIRARELRSWHRQWADKGTSIAHAKMGMLRTLFNFGAVYLESDECARLSGIMHGMRFKMAKPRTERLTAEQATAIRQLARRSGLRSIAWAQAFQFDCTFRQKDVIGEWVPIAEPGVSDVTDGGTKKWLRGIRWEEIDQHMVLRHTTSKRQKDIEIDLTLAPMVVEELTKDFGAFDRSLMPASGPIIVYEVTLRPYLGDRFRINWRKLATQCKIPKSIRNMDTRAGAISEATDAGASLEDVRHAATHSNISTTQNYSRGSTAKVANVMKLRAAHRNSK